MCNTNNADRMNIIQIWLSRQGLQFLESARQEEHELSRTVGDLFETLNSKFKPQSNKAILSLQYCKQYAE